MASFSEITRVLFPRWRARIAAQERYGIGVQPVELIPGMPAAPEPCLLPDGHWSADRHPRSAVVQPKIDGMRALYVQSRIVTRGALPLNAALHCLPALDRLERKMGEAMVFDGEYQEPEGFQATQSAHKRGIGVGTFYLFDAVPYRDWKANHFRQPLVGRLRRIADAVEELGEPFLSFLPPVEARTPEDVMQLAEAAWTRGCEGLVVKAGMSIYTRGRSKDWLKLKRQQSLDGPVVDVVVPEHDPARAVALVKLDGKIVKVAAMPDDVRKLAVRDSYQGGGLTGRMVEVEFNDRTESGALRGAKITRLRPDKES